MIIILESTICHNNIQSSHSSTGRPLLSSPLSSWRSWGGDCICIEIFPDINISYWPGLARVVMREWNPTLGWTSQTIFVISGLTVWHHLDITCTVSRQNRTSPSQGVPILPHWDDCFITNISILDSWYNQTEDCNYPYFVFLLNLWSRKFLICLKHDRQSEEGRVQTRSSPDLLSQEGLSPLRPPPGLCYFTQLSAVKTKTTENIVYLVSWGLQRTSNW